MNLKTLLIIAASISLCACASIPPPPHCEDNGKGIMPINPEMLTQEQLNAHRTTHKITPNIPLGHPRNGDH